MTNKFFSIVKRFNRKSSVNRYSNIDFNVNCIEIHLYYMNRYVYAPKERGSTVLLV